MEKIGSLLTNVLARASRMKAREDSKSENRDSVVKQTPEPAPTEESPRTQSVRREFPKRPYRPRQANRPASQLTSIEGILSKALSQKGLDKAIAKYRFVQHWEAIVGPDVARITKPECLRREVLVVRVENSVWAQELSFRKFDILQKLQPFLADGQVVDDLAFYVAGG